MLRTQIPSFFKQRREKAAQLRPGAAFVFAANPHPLRNSDVHYGYRQDSSFLYLSGFDEPQSFLLVLPRKDGPGSSRMVLFVQKRDPAAEIWDGERYGVDGARSVFGADEAFLTEEWELKAPEFLKDCDEVYYRIGRDLEADRKVLGALDAALRLRGKRGGALAAIRDPDEVIGEMRLLKGPEEVEALRKAAAATVAGHEAAMRETRPGMAELEVEAILDYHFRKNGCARNGYGSIVAGGANATCLHYVRNNDTLKAGQLLLIDAAGEYDHYSSDITRTFPVSPRFSTEQAKIYDLVLKAQKEVIDLIRPGLPYGRMHERATEVLVEGLLSLGLLAGDARKLIEAGGQRRFYPHGTGHWLGMDVHDTGRYRLNGDEPRKLEPGMVFTVEPGIYIQPGDREAPEAYRGIGVRIEDDILVTPHGCEVLTRALPKERAEVEALRSGG